jgi:TraM recognition site of TraD and TraG
VIESFNHTFVDGVSGVGKSTLLEDVAIQLIRAGKPLLYMDPHGTSARRILNHIPKRYSERVVYINPLAKKVPGISIFCGTTKEEKELDIASLSSILKSTAGDAWGFETANVIDGAATAAVESMEHPTMAHVYLFIMRKLLRKKMIAKANNPLLVDFALEYDDGLRASERMAKFAPAINKLKPFVRPIIRTIFNQTTNLPLIELMNNAIIIVDLDKGKIGDVNAALIGSAILNHIGIYAFRRPAQNRQEFTIIVDEFQTFSHGINWTTFFAELRKFGIRCWLATQSVSQVPERWMDSILGNVNNLICFAVGDRDAERIADAYGDLSLAPNLIWLDDHEFYAKVKIGKQRHLFEHVRAFELLPKYGDESKYADVLKTSRMRWGKSRKGVDAGILKLLREGLDVKE